MDANTAAQLLGVAAYTVQGVELDAERNVWLVTVRDMCSHTNAVRELPREKATGGIVTCPPIVPFVPTGETGPEETGPLTAKAEVIPAAKPKPTRKTKAKS